MMIYIFFFKHAFTLGVEQLQPCGSLQGEVAMATMVSHETEKEENTQ